MFPPVNQEEAEPLKGRGRSHKVFKAKKLRLTRRGLLIGWPVNSYLLLTVTPHLNEQEEEQRETLPPATTAPTFQPIGDASCEAPSPSPSSHHQVAL